MTTAPLSSAAGRAGRAGSTRLPRLRVLPRARQRAARVPFALVVLFVIGAGLIGLLLLNTVLAQGAFVLHDLQNSTVTLGDREQELARTVAAEEAPAVLAQRAAALGMVPGGDPAFLRLSDGKILGKPKPALAPPPAPSPSASGPSASPSRSPSAARSASPSGAPTGATSRPVRRPNAARTPTRVPTPGPTPTPSGRRP